MKNVLFFSFLINIFSFIVQAQVDEFEPVQCRYRSDGIEKRASCSRLKGIKSATKNPIGNACLFKGGQWQFGELKPDPKVNSTYKFRFKSKFVCTSGIVAINRDAQPQGHLGPSLSQAFSNSKVEKVTVTKDAKNNPKEVAVPGYPKKHITFDSTAYYGAPTLGASVALKDLDSSKFNIIGCSTEKDKTLSCTNNNSGSSVVNSGFCAPKNLKTGYVQDNRAFKGHWYVRYNQNNMLGFDVCKNGIVVRNAKEQADQSDSDVQLIKDIDKVAVNTFIASYSDGDSMTSGLGTWFGVLDTKIYRNIASCIVKQGAKEIRYPCNRRSVIVTKDPMAAKDMDSGSCYASKTGGWKVRVDTGTTLKNCDFVQLMNTKMIEPN